MSPWKRTFITFVAALGLLVAIFTGQACQQNNETIGNGGGYGGVIRPELVENYTLSSHRSYFGITYNDSYYHFSESTVCSSGPTSLGTIGEYVDGGIFPGQTGTGFEIQTDGCSGRAAINMGLLDYADFNQEVFLYGGRVHLFYEYAPTQSSDMKSAVAHCRVIDGTHGVETGWSTTIFSQNGALISDLYQAYEQGGQFLRKVFTPAPVTAVSSGGSATFSRNGYEISVVRLTSTSASATLNVNIEGSPHTVNLDCAVEASNPYF